MPSNPPPPSPPAPPPSPPSPPSAPPPPYAPPMPPLAPGMILEFITNFTISVNTQPDYFDADAYRADLAREFGLPEEDIVLTVTRDSDYYKSLVVATITTIDRIKAAQLIDNLTPLEKNPQDASKFLFPPPKNEDFV